jgi:predicted GIY-YIG superfamily endonuclease
MTDPAVYRIYDATGRLIYVGATGNVEQRLGTHRTQAWWWSLVDRVETEPHQELADAFAAELDAILAEKPVFNVRNLGGWQGARRRFTAADRAACRAWHETGHYLPVSLRWVAYSTP